MRVVLDANILIAAFAARGLCQAVFEHCLDNHEIVLSEHLLAAVRKQLHKKVKVPVDTVEEIDQFLRSHARIIEPAFVDPSVCRDKNDLPVLGTAVASNASYLVTGDRDLLSINSYSGVPILGPRRFWEEVRRKRR